MNTIKINDITVGPGSPLLIIAGPCLIESANQCLNIAETLRDRCAQLGLSFVFKASFDKANRSSIHSSRGPGLEDGLEVLSEVKNQIGVTVTTDVHEPSQCPVAGRVADMVQVPAFLCRQTDLLMAAAQTGKPVNVKKGQFMSPSEMTNVVDKLNEAGGEQLPGIMLTERGTFFGYNRLVNDFIGLGDMMDLGHPVCFDVTHSTQQPGGAGNMSGGRPDRAPMLAKAAVAAGVDALFIETHTDPLNAQSDAATMLPIDTTVDLLKQVADIHQACQN